MQRGAQNKPSIYLDQARNHGEGKAKSTYIIINLNFSLINMDILKWENPKKTGLFFLAGNMFFLGLLYMNIVSLLTLFLLFLAVLGLFINSINQFLNPETVKDQKE